MTETGADARVKIVTAAAHLLRTGGAKAVTTRAVAQEAGVPAPTIFRLFGDKDGLLEAVAEQLMADHVTEKSASAAAEDGDPVEDLRAAWRTHLAFSLAHPDVFLLLTGPGRRRSPAATGGTEVLRARITRLAAAGLLNVSVARAVDLVHAAGSGAVLALLGKPEDQRDPQLADVLLEAVLGQVLTTAPAPPAADPLALVLAFEAALPELPSLSDGERTLLTEWLSRTTTALQDQRRR
ncbi:TetR/AcrR family transcriptional regulator [Lentzea sp. NPDC042327]|uniref:TetR/AcrR family transcriptional regulator n=1 Tax=Lentzea sp. NPDC042327 TaxID=3154801 RepID=UPI0033BFF2D5